MSFASTALAAPATVGMGTAKSFSVLGGSTITNTGPTTMFGDLGLSPGSSVTGAPHVLGETHVDDAVAIAAKNALTTAYNDAASRPTEGSAGTDLTGQTFTAGVRTASSSLLLSSGSVTLDAQGNPNAVFIFQIGSTLTTGSNTSVSLINGAQACNVFWQVGSSATLGTGTRFVGTVMAAATITTNTAATVHGRLLAETGAVNLDTNTITASTCAIGGAETATPTETVTLEEATKLAETIGASATAGVSETTGTTVPIAATTPVSTGVAPALTALTQPNTTATAARRVAAKRAAARQAAAKRKAARRAARRRRHEATVRHMQARPPTPSHHGSFTG
ncbi:MAG TPA: ice-binding family protein [Solirubrobacteraceae bacterium]|nr:ice-binding family protein [Solirubrobacteraceae bacterium]